MAVNRGHQGCGVRDDPALGALLLGLFCGLRLRLSDAQLFMGLRCAAFAVTPGAQYLIDGLYRVTTQADHLGQRLREGRFAGAFRAHDGDAQWLHDVAFMRTCQARQPHKLISANKPYSRQVSHSPL